MTSFLRAAALTAGLFPVLCALPAVAAQRQLVEKVGDWEVERTIGDTSAHPCLISKTYQDKEDHNLVNGIVFSLDGSDVALALVYQGWEWDKGDKVKANFLAGKKVLKKQVSWNADAQVLASGFPGSIVPDLLATDTLVLKFDDGDADFDITGFPKAYEALHRCDATPAKAAAPAATAAPAVPSQTHIQAYAYGLMLQTMFKSCDFATTGKQRTAVDGKIAAMQSEMAPVESILREKLKAQPQDCPKATDEAEVQSSIKDFVELSPEAFVAAMDKKSADKAAKAEPKAEAPKTEAPKSEAPKADAPATDAPKP